MEHISEILKQFPGTPHQDALPNSTKRKATFEAKKCDICGKEYQLWVFHRDTEDYYQKPCSDCRNKQIAEESSQRLKEGLQAVIDSVQGKWFDEIIFPSRFIEKASEGFKSFNRELQPKAYDVIKNYDNKSIVLSSPELYGVGKTHLVCCLAWHLLESKEAAKILGGGYIKYPCPVFIITETNLLSRIRETYNKHEDPKAETEEQVFKKLAGYETLIIDDVGKVRPKDYAFLQSVYFRIIDNAYTAEHSIIITTNLSFKDLEEHIGGACADRLREMAGSPDNFVSMKGKSMRGKTTNDK